MNTDRPVNLELSTIKFPITAIVSILHRISGVALLVGVIGLLFMLDMSLSSEASYLELQNLFAETWIKTLLWLILVALVYHFLAGIRHLFMDLGVGESLRGGRVGAQLVLVFAIVLAVAIGGWIW